MISVKGTIRNGMALPVEPVTKADEGRSVMITFVDDEPVPPIRSKENGSKSLEDLIAECQVDTGITDLASQHDHYLYGKPKK
jgi:hypothetical protein